MVNGKKTFWGLSKDFKEQLQHTFAFRQGFACNWAGHSFALMQLLAYDGTCESAVITVRNARKCLDAMPYNESAIMCCALELCYCIEADFADILQHYFCKDKDTFSVKYSQFEPAERFLARGSNSFGWKNYPPLIHDGTSIQLMTAGAVWVFCCLSPRSLWIPVHFFWIWRAWAPSLLIDECAETSELRRADEIPQTPVRSPAGMNILCAFLSSVITH